MENLDIQQSHARFFMPEVHFDAEKGHCSISGQSYPENANKFYGQLVEWVERFRDEVSKPLVVEFKLTYFNSSSSKGLLRLLHAFNEYKETTAPVEIVWYYPDNDMDMQEEAEDFVEDSPIAVRLEAFTPAPSPGV